MSVVVTARHMRHIGDIQNHAREKGESLVEDFPKVEHVHVILSKEKHVNRAEVVIQAKKHRRIEAESSSGNMRASVDSAFDKAERQLRKFRDKVRDHHPKKRRATIRNRPVEEIPDDTGEDL